jgi:GNAT superfamily N-acetyltransferase
MTTTWRLRVELTDRPGTLARLATSLAARQCNILALTVLPAPDGVIDDIVVSVPDELRPADLVIVVRAVGGRCAGITKADLTELTDAPTATLRVAARLVDGSAGYAETIRALLEADAAGGLAARDLGDSRTAGSMAGGSVGVTTGAAASDAGGATTGAAVTSSGGAARSGAAAASGSSGATRTGGAAVDGAAVGGSGGPVTVWAADGTGIVVRRGWAPFAAVELARAVALADLVQALGKTDAQAVITRDGAGIVLRDGRSTDADAVAAMHDRCSRATLFARYHAGTRTIPRRLLHRWLAPPRGRTVLGLVGRQVIAVGQLINTNDPRVGEVSLLVEDDWQGQGVGAALLTHLVRAARAAGHAELFGWCLPGEPGLTKAAQRAGFPVSTRREDDLLRVSLNTHYWPLGASSPRS